VTRWLRAFALFWYDFIVGDDWSIAVGVVAALAVTAVLTRAGVAAWWVLPVAVAALLGLSLLRELRRREPGRREPGQRGAAAVPGSEESEPC
jgi:membrane protein implicated in regulation of membrane protease activity